MLRDLKEQSKRYKAEGAQPSAPGNTKYVYQGYPTQLVEEIGEAKQGPLTWSNFQQKTIDATGSSAQRDSTFVRGALPLSTLA